MILVLKTNIEADGLVTPLQYLLLRVELGKSKVRRILMHGISNNYHMEDSFQAL